MPQIIFRKQGLWKLWVLIVLFVGAAMAVVAGIIVINKANHDRSEQARYEATMRLAAGFKAHAKYGDEERVLTEYLASSPADTYAQGVTLELAVAYTNDHKPAEALKTYLADEQKFGEQSPYVMAAIGNQATAAGDKATAASHYRKAVELAEKSDSSQVKMALPGFRAKLAAVEGGGGSNAK